MNGRTFSPNPRTGGRSRQHIVNVHVQCDIWRSLGKQASPLMSGGGFTKWVVYSRSLWGIDIFALFAHTKKKKERKKKPCPVISSYEV